MSKTPTLSRLTKRLSRLPQLSDFSMGSYMTKEVIPFLQFIEKQSTGLDMFIGYLAQNINTSMSSDRKGLKMPLNKTQILMYSALIPAAIISLAAPACAPKKINPESSTLTEKTQQIQEANLSKGIVDLVKNSIKKLPTKARNTTYGRLSYSRREPPWELASVTDVVADTLYLRGQQETDGFYTADTFDVYSWHGNVFLKVASSQGTNWKREHHTFYDLDIDGVFD